MTSRPPHKSTGGRTSTSSDPSQVADAFGRLNLNSGEDGRQGARHSPGEWIGGFAPHPNAIAPGAVPPPPILHHSGAHSTPVFAFPEPDRYGTGAPGPLPRPPAMPMPTPQTQTSLTMQYALVPPPPPLPPKTDLRPPTMTRPHSDSGAYRPTNQLQVPPTTPQRPQLQQAPNSAPAKPGSSAPDSRPSPLQTPTKRPRAASSPPSPTASSSGKGGLKVQCSGTTKLDKRCTRMVAVTAPLSRLNGEDLPHYCHQHMKNAFDDVKFPSHKDSSVWVEFKGKRA